MTSATATVRRTAASTLRLKRAGLARGRYRVRLVAVDASGNRSASYRLRLRVR